jgi:hypothetical protein
LLIAASSAFGEDEGIGSGTRNLQGLLPSRSDDPGSTAADWARRVPEKMEIRIPIKQKRHSTKDIPSLKAIPLLRRRDALSLNLDRVPKVQEVSRYFIPWVASLPLKHADGQM